MTDLPVPSPASTPDELQAEIDNLRRLMKTLPIIEQAKGVLMHRYDLDAQHAFDLLARWSQALGQRVSIVAAVVLEIAQVTGVRTTDPDLVTALEAQMGGAWKRTSA